MTDSVVSASKEIRAIVGRRVLKDQYSNMAFGMAIGVGVGTAIGTALDDLPIGIAMGIAIGPAFGALRRK
jgi:hypothetical protein